MKLQREVPTIAVSQSAPVGPDGETGILLDGLGELADERALVLGPDIAVMCGLIRRGCEEVTELEQNERPEARHFSLVIVSALRSTDMAACAIAHARRGLAPAGRIVVRTATDPSGQLGQAIERALRLHGFSLIRSRRIGTGAVFSGELPLLGPVVQAHRPRALIEIAAAGQTR
jgi:hypothetical protein